MTAAQSGLLDRLPLTAIAKFRDGLVKALERDAAEALALLQRRDVVDGAAGHAFAQALRRHAEHFASGAP